MNKIRRHSKSELRALARGCVNPVCPGCGRKLGKRVRIKKVPEGETGALKNKDGNIIQWRGRRSFKKMGKRKFMSKLDAILLTGRKTALG